VTKALVPLRDLADLLPGFAFRKIEFDPLGAARLLQARNVDDDLAFDPTALPRVRFESDLAAFRVVPGDVLLMTTGTRHWALVVRTAIPDLVAPSYLLRLRSRGRVMPDYLAWYLNHPRTEERLAALRQGTNIPFLRRADLAGFEVELPPPERQAAIVHLDELSRREQQLSRRLAESHQRFLQSATWHLMASTGKERR
jgi:hypothetical protein